MKDEIVSNLPVANINPKYPDYFKQNENIYFGAGFEVALNKNENKLTKMKIAQIRVNFMNFYINLCTEIRTRTDFSNKVLNEICNVLNIDNIFKENKPSILKLAVEFPNILDSNSLEDINLEWRLLNEYKGNQNLNNMEELIFYLVRLIEYIFKNVFLN